MADSDQDEPGIDWNEQYGLKTELDEEDVNRRIESMRSLVNGENADRDESNEDMPHTVTFVIEYEREQFVRCRANAFPNKEKAIEAKSNLDLVENVLDTRVERV